MKLNVSPDAEASMGDLLDSGLRALAARHLLQMGALADDGDEYIVMRLMDMEPLFVTIRPEGAETIYILTLTEALAMGMAGDLGMTLGVDYEQ